jgi:TolA-binding protein
MLLTIVPLQTAGGAGAIAVAADVAEIVVAVAMLVLALLAITLFVRLNGLLGELRSTARTSFGPVSDRAKVISDNVEYITQALRTDVEKLNASVRSLSDRLQLASERMEERIEEFNALMEVVQDEAEDVFLDTASTVRGVREGARAITDRSPRREPPASPTADDAGRGVSTPSDATAPSDA